MPFFSENLSDHPLKKEECGKCVNRGRIVVIFQLVGGEGLPNPEIT
jgi:hypothetical protein